MIVGNQKGRDTKQRLARNFGQAKPEGYRKALRAMQLAAKYRRPIFVFVDTPGAYPGIDAEERGQAEAIALNLREMSRLPVPIVITVTGEGGSGGALAIAVGDRVLMLENSVYSVISPEGCASIMWRDSSKAEIGRRGPENYRAGSPGTEAHRRNRPGTGRRRSYRPRRRGQDAVAGAVARARRALRVFPKRSSSSATKSSATWASSSPEGRVFTVWPPTCPSSRLVLESRDFRRPYGRTSPCRPMARATAHSEFSGRFTA